MKQGIPRVWRHKWRPIQFRLFVDDFGVEYVVKQHSNHLATILNKYHNITEDWEGKKYSGLDLKWDYEKKHVGKLWMNTSWTSGTNINTFILKNHNIHHTNTAPSIMELHNN